MMNVKTEKMIEGKMKTSGYKTGLIILLLLQFALGSASAAEKSLDLSPAKWIWYPSKRTLQNTFIFFRKEINIESEVQSAKGWIFADSRYQLFVNGQRVQWGPAPSDPRWQEADPINLGKYLHVGINVIACQVLFYGAGDGTSPVGVPGFIFKLDIDGKTVVSDKSWDCYLARCWKPGQYKRWYLRSLQEDFDVRLYPEGWNSTGFTEKSEWLASVELPGPSDKSSISDGYPDYLLGIKGNTQTELRERSVPPMLENKVRVKQLTESFWIDWKLPVDNYFDMNIPDAYVATKMEPAPEYKDTAVTIFPKGDQSALLTFEFAQQSVGFPYFTIDAPAGTVVEILVQEAHRPGNDVIFNSHFNSWSRFICKEGLTTFATFDYESLRWMQLHVRNFNRPVRILNVGMLRRCFDFSVLPQIQVSDTGLQKLIDANINTLFNSCQETMVDGMGRERQQYSGDAGHQLHPLFQVFGETRLPYRFISTFSQGITKEGFFLDCWPAYDRLARMFERQMDLSPWGPLLDHGVGFCFDTYNYYLYTGKREDIDEVYPRLIRFYNYLKTLVDKQDGLIKVVDLGVPCVWMDHDAFSWKNQQEKQLSFNLYTSAMCKNALSKLCALYGDKELESNVLRFSRELLKHCVKKYWDTKEKTFVDNLPWIDNKAIKRYSDRTLATALLFHQCPDNDESRSLELLKKQPLNLGISYPCNAVWRMWALSENNEMDLVLNELRDKWVPMPSVTENNTLSEFLNAKPDNESQWSHSAVAPLLMLYQGLAGAVPLAPGGTRYRIWPRPLDIKSIDLDIRTVNGGILFKSEGVKGERIISIICPDKVDVELWLDQREKIDFPVIETRNGIKKYLLKRGTSAHLELKYT